MPRPTVNASAASLPIVAGVAFVGRSGFIVAVHAGRHCDVFLLDDNVALCDRPVTAFAIALSVTPVGKPDVVRQLIDSRPRNRLFLTEIVRQEPNRRAVGLYACVTGHALGFIRKSSGGSFPGNRVTPCALQAKQVMRFMAEGYRLPGLDPQAKEG